MNYRKQIKQVVQQFIPECEKAFLKEFLLNDLDFGRDLPPGERTGAIDWYSVGDGDLTGNVMIAIGCDSRLNAEIEKTTEALFIRHGIYNLNEFIKRTEELMTAKVTLSGNVNTATTQQVSSHLWLAVVTFEVKCFIGL